MTVEGGVSQWEDGNLMGGRGGYLHEDCGESVVWGIEKLYLCIGISVVEVHLNRWERRIFAPWSRRERGLGARDIVLV